MRIFVEPSDYILRNAGDMAMLHVAVTRLSKLWPDASIQVLSDVPDLLPAFCPNAIPLDTKGRRVWFANGFLLGRLSYYLPDQLRMRVWEWEHYLRRRWPSLVEFILKFRLKLAGNDGKDLRDFLEAVSQADLVIANGMGGITDAFPDYAFQLLDTLRLGIQRGAVTAMVGQGMGPLQDPNLRSQAQAVLPHINFISLREERAGRPLLYSLGVSPDRLLTTGDDAIEMAYQLHTEQLGCGIGVNLRAANYSAVDQHLIEQLRPILQDAARKHQAPMIPVPISRVPEEADADTIRQLIAGYDELSDGGTEIDTPLKVIEQIKRCRVVLTGSYHAGVFALSLGIPVIGMAKSAYYVDKFLGLADQFGTGCEVVFLNDTDLSAKLTAAIERAWQSAEQVKPQLLAAAARQVELSHAAYQRVYELVRKPSCVTAKGQLVQKELMAVSEQKPNEEKLQEPTEQINEPVSGRNLETSDSDNVLVSVIIPCYNQAHFLGEAIESVLAQSYPHFEIIVVDDGSPDNTAEVAAQYQGVRYIRQENQGLAGARNTGLGESQGKYLVFLDADDRLVPDALQAGLNCLHAHPECAFVSGHHRYINGDGSLRNEYPQQPIDSDHYLALLQRNYIGMHATVMYRRDVLESVGGFDTSLKSCEDYDLYLRITRRFPVYRHTQMVAEYRWHDTNMSNNSERMLKSALAALGSQWEYVKEKPQYIEAYKTGIRFWRNYFAQHLIRRVGSSLGARKWQQAMQGLLMLLRYCPLWFAALLMETASSPVYILHTLRTLRQRTYQS